MYTLAGEERGHAEMAGELDTLTRLRLLAQQDQRLCGHL